MACASERLSLAFGRTHSGMRLVRLRPCAGAAGRGVVGGVLPRSRALRPSLAAVAGAGFSRLRVVEILVWVEVGGIGELGEEVPDARLAEARAEDRERIVRVREGECRVVGLAAPVAALDRERDDVRRHAARVRIVAREEVADARLVGVRHEVAVGHAERHPHRALLEAALADELHVPDLAGRRVGDREALHVARVAVPGGELAHHGYRLARRRRARERHPDQRAVVEDRAVPPVLPHVGELGEAAERRSRR